jgi:hypothetical protein
MGTKRVAMPFSYTQPHSCSNGRLKIGFPESDRLLQVRYMNAFKRVRWGDPGGYCTDPVQVGGRALLAALLLCGLAVQEARADRLVSLGQHMMPLLPLGARFTAVAAGRGHSLALRPDGTVVGGETTCTGKPVGRRT